MANIENEIQSFREAIYGEDVRGSMISLAEKLNAEGEQVVSEVAEAVEKAETASLAATKAVREAEQATREANAASEEAKHINQQSEENVTAARSWAIGETGTREGENTDNSKYYSQMSAEQAERSQIEADASKAEADRAKAEADRASKIVGVGIATDDDAGFIKGNPDEFMIDSEGKLSLTSAFSKQDALTEITGTESKKTLFGKLAKAVSDLVNHIGDTARHFTLTNNLMATAAGTALDAAQGKTLNEKIEDVERQIINKSMLQIDNATIPFTLYRNGYIIEMQFGRNKVALSNGLTYLLSTIPVEYRPAFGFTQMIAIGRFGGNAYIYITKAGEVGIRIYTDVSENDYTFARFTYIAGN